MKRMICFIMIVSTLFLFSSCELSSQPAEDSVIFYYRSPKTEFGSQAELIIGEVRDAKGHTEDYSFLIEQYFNGPRTYDCISPFPAGTTLEELSFDSSKAYIVLTSQIATLSGSELMLACACLTKTVLEITGVDSVQISSSNGTLNAMESITLSADSFTYLLE